MNKQNNAALLFLAMGQIDDKLIAESATLTYKQPTSLWKRYALTAAAVIAVVLTVAMLATSVNRGKDLASNANGYWLQQTLANASDDEIVTKLDAEEIDLFNGKASLIWQLEGEERYCVADINISNGVQRINQLLAQDEREMAPATATALPCKLWISYGNGYVVSPELKYTAGNLGFGELFDYTAEIYPSEQLSKLLESVIPTYKKEYKK